MSAFDAARYEVFTPVHNAIEPDGNMYTERMKELGIEVDG